MDLQICVYMFLNWFKGLFYDGTSIVELLDKNAVMPTKAHRTDSGYDLYLPEDKALAPNEVTPIDTLIRVKIPKGYEIQIRSRSGLAIKRKLMVANQPGTIDQEYTGHIIVGLYNAGTVFQHLKKGERIAQMVFQKVPDIRLERGYVLTETERGEGGIGSTGK